MEILKAVMRVSHHHRARVVEAAFSLMTAEMDWHERVNMIGHIGGMRGPINEGDAASALRFITREMGWGLRLGIFQAVVGIPTEERGDVIEQALQLIDPEMDGGERIVIIQRVTRVLAQGRAAYVQLRRGRRQAHLVGRVRPEQGINVHQGKWDQQVRAPLELLRQDQGEMPEERIEQTVGEFTQYLNDHKNTEHKELALNALRAPKE